MHKLATAVGLCAVLVIACSSGGGDAIGNPDCQTLQQAQLALSAKAAPCTGDAGAIVASCGGNPNPACSTDIHHFSACVDALPTCTPDAYPDGGLISFPDGGDPQLAWDSQVFDCDQYLVSAQTDCPSG
jgi:hypothetical protein